MALRRGNRVSEFTRGIEPQPDCLLSIGESRFLCIAVGHTPRQFGHLGDEDLIFFAPIKDDFVFSHLVSASDDAFKLPYFIAVFKWKLAG